jgi:hypothetical protein
MAGYAAENIAFFDPEIDMARVVEVGRQACVHDEIQAMPLATKAPSGDMGSALSGGQKQRILLARALYGRRASCSWMKRRRTWTILRGRGPRGAVQTQDHAQRRRAPLEGD